MTTTAVRPGAASYDPTREVRTATEWPTNGHMIADMHRIGFIRDADVVVDITYGLGVFWSVYRPEHLIAHDLDPRKGDGVDWRQLPEADGSADVVVFDGPYVCPGGRTTSTIDDMHDRFGMRMTPKNPDETHDYLASAFPEIARVLRPKILRHPDPRLRTGGLALVKCADYVWGGRYRRAVDALINSAEGFGLTFLDMAIYIDDPGPQPPCRVCRGKKVDPNVDVKLHGSAPPCPKCDGSGKHPQDHLRSNCSNLIILRNDNLGTIAPSPGLFDG